MQVVPIVGSDSSWIGQKLLKIFGSYACSSWKKKPLILGDTFSLPFDSGANKESIKLFVCFEKRTRNICEHHFGDALI